MSVLLAHTAQQNQRSFRPGVPDLEDLKTVVRVAATAKLADESAAVWARATLGELHLILGHPQQALEEHE